VSIIGDSRQLLKLQLIMSDKKVFVLISKDALCKDYLHLYGQKPYQFETPNIDELASKGTLFTKYYCAAPSTVMAFYSMGTGQFAHETDFQMYERIHYHYKGQTAFTKMKEFGYEESHIVWDEDWGFLPEYFDYYRDDVKIHNIDGFRERVSFHKKVQGDVRNDDAKAFETMGIIKNYILKLLDTSKSVFIWLHLPHVVRGRAGYGSDIDMFDKYVGMVRSLVPDDCIAVTADHGNLNGYRNKLAYGFDPYERAIRIPLITPRIEDCKICDWNVSSVDLFEILLKRVIPKRDFIYSDTAYRAQKSRKLAIIKDNYKYIYTKKTGLEELYDLVYDPEEQFSLIDDKSYDVDRKLYVDSREEYYYPFWDKLPKIREDMRCEKARIWRNGDFKVVLKSNLKDVLRPFYERYLRFLKNA